MAFMRKYSFYIGFIPMALFYSLVSKAFHRETISWVSVSLLIIQLTGFFFQIGFLISDWRKLRAAKKQLREELKFLSPEQLKDLGL
jgi:hypothetical protein